MLHTAALEGIVFDAGSLGGKVIVIEIRPFETNLASLGVDADFYEDQQKFCRFILALICTDRLKLKFRLERRARTWGKLGSVK